MKIKILISLGLSTWLSISAAYLPFKWMREENYLETRRDEPMNFSWIDEHVGGMARPRYPEVIHYLEKQQVGLIISLTEDPLPSNFFTDTLVKSLHIPVNDFEAPSSEQVTTAIAAIRETIGNGKNVVIHCLGGRGRTGTMLACWLIANQGISAQEAITTIRGIRPGSIETIEQVKFIQAFAENQTKASTEKD